MYFGLNIKTIREYWNLSQTEFGYLIDASRGMIMQYETRGTLPKNETIERLMSLTKFTKDKLFNTKIKREELPDYSQKDFLAAKERYLKRLTEATEVHEDEPSSLRKKNVGVPFYFNVNASAGLSFLTNNETQDFEIIKIPHVDAEAFINVFGDSMYPLYVSGQIIGIKQIEKEYVMFGHAYVVQMKNGEAYLKYIMPGKDDDHWLLDNENKKFKAKEFHLSKIEKVYIIKAVITKTTL